MKKKIFVLGALLVSLCSSAQIRAGFESNAQWYIDDKKIRLDPQEAEDRIRNNSYLKLDYDFNNWSFGTQLEGYVPRAIMNYSPELDGFNIGTIYARYNNLDLGLDVTAGHFYEQFGSGLLFRSWEDKQLGVNNAILGLNAKYSFDSYAKVTLMGGKQRVGMGFDLSNSLLMGADVEIGVDELLSYEETSLTFGLSYLGIKYDKQDVVEGLEDYKDGYAVRVDFADGGFYAGAEYVKRAIDNAASLGTISRRRTQEGEGVLFNGGYSKKGIALNTSLRRIQSMSNYSERELYGNDYLVGVVNYVPALTKQYDYSLQNIYVYQAQSNFDYLAGREGEIGGQFDFYYELKKGSGLGGKYGANLVVNGSYWAGLKTIVDFESNSLDSEYFAFGEKYYKDLGVEFRKKWSSSWSSVFMYLNQYYNTPVLLGKGDAVNANIVSAESTYQFRDNKSVRLELQHLWADADKKNWVGGTVEFAANSNWSFYISDMYNYGNDIEEDRIHYYNVGASFTKGTTRVSAGYGRQRGGLLCVGGVCRMVSEAAGLTLGITTSF